MKFMKPDETARCVMFVVDVADLDGDTEQQREALTSRLSRYESFKTWAFVLHDRDDEPPHWQGFVAMDKNIAGQAFASRLGVKGVYKLSGGKEGINRALKYLTHEDHPQKAQYARSEITAMPGWDWQTQLDDAVLKDASRGSSGRKKVIASVQDGHVSALEAIRRGASNERALRIARARYLRSVGSEDLPAVRVNFYLQGPAHPSIDRLAHALARTLSGNFRFYDFNGRDVDEYDGEDVVLMRSDLRAWLHEVFPGSFLPSIDGPLGGPRELFGLLSATPTPHSFMTKFGKTQLIHRHTVIVGEAPFEDFRDRLENLYQHAVDDGRDQAELSLPIIVPVDADSFQVQVSERFALGRGEFGQYVESEHYRLALAQAVTASRGVPSGQRATLVRDLEQQQTAPIREAGATVAQALRPADQLPTEVLATFSDLGMPIVEGELT